MSFVIGKSIGDNVLLFADTLTTDENGEETKLTDHVAKLVSLGPALCVGWAGRDGPAHEAIRSFKAPGTPWVRHTIKHFLNAHLASIKEGLDTDFLLGLGDPIYRLIEIKSGEARMVSHDVFAWLGVQAARERFQKAWSERTPLTDFGEGAHVRSQRSIGRGQAEFDRMYKAMEHVVGSVPSVDGFITAVANYPLPVQGILKNGVSLTRTVCGLLYVEVFETRTRGPEFALAEMEPIIMGHGKEVGSYAKWTMCGITPSGQPVPVIYLPQPRFGIAFLPEAGGLLKAAMIKGSDFAQQLQAQYGVSLPAWPGPDLRIAPGRRGPDGTILTMNVDRCE